MGNRLSSANASNANVGEGDGARRGSSFSNSTRSPSSWLLKRLEKKPAMSMEKRRRLSSAIDTDGELVNGKVYSLSEATTMLIGDQYLHGLSSGDEEAEENDDQDAKPAARRSSLWQQMVGRVMTQCCGSAKESPTTPSTSPSHRKRRRSPEQSIAEIEEKHRAFWALVQKLLALNDVVAMIRELQDYLADHVGASQSAVFLVDPNHSSMSRVIRGQGTLSSISQQRGLVGHVISSKTPLCRQLFAQHLSYDGEIDLPQESVYQKLMSVPLLENNNVYAVVQLTTKDVARSDALDELDMKLVSWLGPILSSCMRKCIEFHDVLLSDRTQKALLHIISSSDTEDTVLNLVDGVITGASHITKSERLSLFMVDWEHKELWTLSSSFHEETIRVPLEGSTLGYAALHRVTLNIADAQNDPLFIKDLDEKRGIATRCALYVPVGIENAMNCDHHSHPMAVLEILNKEGGGPFSLDDECAFEAFASEVAVILRRRSNEIEYIKLLADTRAEKVLAQRAKSQVNLLECYTEYVANANANHAADRLRHSFFKSHSKGCLVCTADQEDGTAKCTSIDRADVVDRGHDSDEAQAGPTLNTLDDSPHTQLPAWEFNIFATDADTLPGMVLDMFFDFGIVDILHTDKSTLRNFIFAVKETYHPNPFHNYLHAVSVVHMAYTILKTTDAATMLPPLDVAACLIAAYCHDVDHPGHTNSFEIISKSPLAMLYSDESVLERHHASTTFRILLKDKSANILQNLTTADFRYIRKMIVTAILSTDMAQHFKMCESMEKMLHPIPHHKSTSSVSSMTSKRESTPPPSKLDIAIEAGLGTVLPIAPSLSSATQGSSEILNVVREAVFQAEVSGSTPGAATNSTKPLSARVLGCNALESCPDKSPYQCNFNGSLEERTFLIKSIVHASDLCGQTFPKPIALKWSNMISKEFAYQALLEQAENLPISFQHLDDPLQMVEGQHFFAHKIVFPLWSLMHQMFPELETCVKNVSGNVAHYEREIQRLKERKSRRDAAAGGAEEGSPIGCSIVGGANAMDAAMWSQCDDEGMAVPGLARCTPAKFNSFRALREDSASLSRSASTSMIDDSLFGAKAIEAIELSRSQSEFCRTRSSSTASSAGGGDEEDEEIFEIGDLDCPELLPGMSLR